MAPAVGSSVLISVGVILLAHAAYSAHEHSLLTTARLLASTSASSSTTSSAAISPETSSPGVAPTTLPLDIAIEALASVLLLCIGLVGTAEPLRPIRWRAWAAQADHGALKRPVAVKSPQDEAKYAVTFDWVEQRPGFRDIRREKKDFKEWMAQSKGGK